MKIVCWSSFRVLIYKFIGVHRKWFFPGLLIHDFVWDPFKSYVGRNATRSGYQRPV